MTPGQVNALAASLGLRIHSEDLDGVAAQVNAWLERLGALEALIGDAEPATRSEPERGT
jgi:hypothetical protein